MTHDKTCCNRSCVCNKFDFIKNVFVKFYNVQAKRWERFDIKKVKTRIQKQFDLVHCCLSFNLRIDFLHTTRMYVSHVCF